ncbi:MAG: DsrE family protein [Dehalococcoidia bacterium]|nr:DsrE family protein [Dehalococcoidia bacterium]
MTVQKDKLAFVINTASYERVCFALGLAAAAAATGKDVRILFGHGGIVRLKTGCTNMMGEETDSWVRSQVKWGLGTGRLPFISELLEALKKLGSKVYACPTAMELHQIKQEQLVKEVDEVRSLVIFVNDDMKDASTLYV